MGYQLGHLSVHDVLAHPLYIQVSISYILYIPGYILYGSDLSTYAYQYK